MSRAGSSTGRASITFAAAVTGSNLCQVVWLAAGSQALAPKSFGAVLAAQALYGVLQILIDSGTGYHGARLSARSQLTGRIVRGIVRARVLLACGSVVVALLIGVVAGRPLLVAILPYTAALVMFGLLNVWEPYGRGDVRPYATYLFARSAALALVAAPFALEGGRFPLWMAGAVEVVVILGVASAFRLSLVLPELRASARTEGSWRQIYDIGLPALISQYNFAAPTIILAVCNRAEAAAVVGVALRLVSGVQGLNGAVVSALYPRLARDQEWRAPDARAAGLAVPIVLGVSMGALAAVGVTAHWLADAFLDQAGGRALDALILTGAGAASAGVVLLLSTLLVARHAERSLLPAAVVGAVLITLAGALAVLASVDVAPVVAAAGFVLCQWVTAIMLIAVTIRRAPLPAAARHLALGGITSAALASITMAAWGGTRAPVAGALVVMSIACLVVTLREVRPRASTVAGEPQGAIDGCRG